MFLDAFSKKVVISIGGSKICVARGGSVLAPGDSPPGRNLAPTSGKNSLFENEVSNAEVLLLSIFSKMLLCCFINALSFYIFSL